MGLLPLKFLIIFLDYREFHGAIRHLLELVVAVVAYPSFELCLQPPPFEK
jgi:hypothetical protein